VFLSAYQDDEICRWHTRRPQTETRVLEWFDAHHQDWGSEKGGRWAVAREDGEVLGRIALRGFDFNDGVADVSYWVLSTARDGGVATSAMAALSTWAPLDVPNRSGRSHHCAPVRTRGRIPSITCR
jgi:RimJ/RimL family protein N-acetyltransferase